MDWLWIAGLLVVGLVVLGVILALRIRRNRSAGTEGPDLWDDDATDTTRRRDDPELRDWGHGSGPY